jgi:hypothetical protein
MIRAIARTKYLAAFRGARCTPQSRSDASSRARQVSSPGLSGGPGGAPAGSSDGAVGTPLTSCRRVSTVASEKHAAKMAGPRSRGTRSHSNSTAPPSGASPTHRTKSPTHRTTSPPMAPTQSASGSGARRRTAQARPARNARSTAKAQAKFATRYSSSGVRTKWKSAAAASAVANVVAAAVAAAAAVARRINRKAATAAAVTATAQTIGPAQKPQELPSISGRIEARLAARKPMARDQRTRSPAAPIRVAKSPPLPFSGIVVPPSEAGIVRQRRCRQGN